MKKSGFYCAPQPQPPRPQQLQHQQLSQLLQPLPIQQHPNIPLFSSLPPNPAPLSATYSSQTSQQKQSNVNHQQHHHNSHQQFHNPVQLQLQLNQNQTTISPPSCTVTCAYPNRNATNPSTIPQQLPQNITAQPNQIHSLRLPPQQPVASMQSPESLAIYYDLYVGLLIKYNEITQHNHRLNQQLHAKQNLEKQLQDKQADYISQQVYYDQRLREKEREIGTLKSEALTSNIQFTAQVTKNEKLRETIKKLKSEKKKENKVKSERDRFSKENGILKKDVGDLNEEIINARNDHSKLQEEFEGFKLKSREEKQELNGNIESYKIKMRKLEEELKDSQTLNKAEVEKLQKDLNEAEFKMLSLNSKPEGLCSKNNQFLSESRSFKNTIKSLEDEKIKFESEIKNLSKRLLDTETEKQTQEEMVERLKTELNSFKKQLKDGSNWFENSSKNDLKKDLSLEQSELVKELEFTIKSLNVRIDELMKSEKDLTQQLKEHQLSKRNEKLEVQVKANSQNALEMFQSFKAKVDEIEKANQTIEELNYQLSSLQQQNTVEVVEKQEQSTQTCVVELCMVDQPSKKLVTLQSIINAINSIEPSLSDGDDNIILAENKTPTKTLTTKNSRKLESETPQSIAKRLRLDVAFPNQLDLQRVDVIANTKDKIKCNRKRKGRERHD